MYFSNTLRWFEITNRIFAAQIKNQYNMKSNFIKITLMAFLVVGAFACKNNETETVADLDEAALATEGNVEYVVDTEASKILWEASKPGTTHNGTISLESGVFAINNNEVEAGKFNVEINSIVVEDLEGDEKAGLEAHLKGTAEGKETDFFDGANYPLATFELTGIENDIVKGNLTIKDVTNAVEFPAKQTIENDVLRLESDAFILDRTKWGINFGSKSIFPNLGDKFVSDDMKITISIVAKKA